MKKKLIVITQENLEDIHCRKRFNDLLKRINVGETAITEMYLLNEKNQIETYFKKGRVENVNIK